MHKGSTPASERRFRTLRPGQLPYGAALALQEELLENRRHCHDDTLLLLEHSPVITYGRRASSSHLLVSEGELARRGIEVVRTGRGGDITYHGPGQLVGYPIVDLDLVGRDLHRYLRLLETMLVDVLAAFGVAGEIVPGKTGVWVEGAKTASIGVAVRRWISWHGFALNVGDDLSGFDAIVPCGLPGVAMTSMERLTGRPFSLAEVEEQVIRSFARLFASSYAGEYDSPHPKKTRMA